MLRRRFSSSVMSSDVIPRIDMHQPRDTIVMNILKAADDRGPGFFYLMNHDVPLSLFERTINVAHEFHSKPFEFKKTAVYDVADSKSTKGFISPGLEGAYEKDVTDVRPNSESATRKRNLRSSYVFRYPEFSDENPTNKPAYLTDYDSFLQTITPTDRIGSLDHMSLGMDRFFMPNIWPCSKELPDFQPTVVEYCHEMTNLSNRLFPYFKDVLKEATGIDYDFGYDQGMVTINLAHYPPSKEEDSFGISDHTDWNFLTLLYPSYFPVDLDSEAYTGLEVWFEDRWVRVPHIPGSIIVNQGEMLSRMSLSRLKPPVHRVCMKNNRERVSVVYFSAPNFETILPDPNQPSGKILCGEFYLKRNNMF